MGHKELKISFATFRDKLRPGQPRRGGESQGPKGAPLEKAAAELLAYMYDRSLDAFVPHQPPSVLALYPNWTPVASSKSSLGWSGFQHVRGQFPSLPGYPSLRPDELKFYGGYAIGGPGRRGMYAMSKASAGRKARRWPPRLPLRRPSRKRVRKEKARRPDKRQEARAAAEPAPVLRTDFSETAFWKPQLLTGADGSAAIEFTVPDSVTSWNVWVHAVTRDLGRISRRRRREASRS